MKSRQRITWLIFGVCALLVLEGLGWVTWQMVRLESRERIARREADLQETLRLALWRMDSAVTPLIAAEASRPYFQYRAFYPAERAYTRMLEPVEEGEVLFASPLLTGTQSPLIRLHFEIGPDGVMTSPQAPSGNLRDMAEGQYLSHENVQRAEQWLTELGMMAEAEGAPSPRMNEPADREIVAADAAGAGENGPGGAAENERTLEKGVEDSLASKGGKSGTDYEGRQRAYEQAANTAPQQSQAPTDEAVQRRLQGLRLARESAAREGDRSDERGRDAPGSEPTTTLEDMNLAGQEPMGDSTYFIESQEKSGGDGDLQIDLGFPVEGDETLGRTVLDEAPAAPEIRQGPFVPRWRTDASSGRRELLFVREVMIDGRRLVQGFWVDWPRLGDELLSTIEDLFPSAQLEPVDDVSVLPASDRGVLESELLASIPVRLIPTALPAAALPMMTPTRVTLAFTWVAIIVAIGAIALVLRASMRISERRGRFVSAVTHELRTPMTTFCLYSQMLADGMIREEDRKREYLGTLKQESQRLARIVENVLAYARLGRKQAAKARQAIEVGELLDRTMPALRRRAEQGGMMLVEELAPAVHEALIPGEREGIERILVNLVDNACKYAGQAEDKRVHLAASVSRGRVAFRVTDHGPGVPKSERRRVFAPFKRGKRDDAGPNPGLGLGLALARGLARELGGDLRLLKAAGPGASFELGLPVVG